MYFWTILLLILTLSSASYVGIILFLKKSRKSDMEKYIFRTEEGEEIPIGI